MLAASARLALALFLALSIFASLPAAQCKGLPPPTVEQLMEADWVVSATYIGHEDPFKYKWALVPGELYVRGIDCLFKVDSVLKPSTDKEINALPLQKPIHVQYCEHDYSIISPDKNYKFDESKLPKKGERFILFLNSYELQTDQFGLRHFTTRRGYYGRWAATDANLEKVRKLVSGSAEKLHRLRDGEMVEFNPRTDAEIAGLDGFTRVRMLYLQCGDGVTGSGLSHLRGLPLRELVLGGKKIDDNGIANLSGMKGLMMLSLDCPAVTDAGLLKLNGLSSLTKFLIQCGPGVNGSGLKFLDEAKALSDISMSEATHLTDSGLGNIKSHATLRRMTIHKCSLIGDAGLSQLGGLSSLKRLELQGAKQPLGPGLKAIAGLPVLAELNLSGCKISDSSLNYLSGSKLQRLDLTFTDVTDAGLSQLKSLPALESLTISPRITDAGIKHLKDLPYLKSIDLSHDAITDEGVRQLAQLRGLKSVGLIGTKVTKECVKYLYTMPNLQIVQLENTSVNQQDYWHLTRYVNGRQRLLLGR